MINKNTSGASVDGEGRGRQTTDLATTGAGRAPTVERRQAGDTGRWTDGDGEWIGRESLTTSPHPQDGKTTRQVPLNYLVFPPLFRSQMGLLWPHLLRLPP